MEGNLRQKQTLWGGGWVFTVFVSAGHFRGPLLWEAVPENSQWAFRIILGIFSGIWGYHMRLCLALVAQSHRLSMPRRWGLAGKLQAHHLSFSSLSSADHKRAVFL